MGRKRGERGRLKKGKERIKASSQYAAQLRDAAMRHTAAICEHCALAATYRATSCSAACRTVCRVAASRSCAAYCELAFRGERESMREG